MKRSEGSKLTSLSSCAGCAAKLAQPELATLLKGIDLGSDPRVLVGAGTADDAGVFRIGAGKALVQTVDFFTPIVDDPYAYGAIAATNAISDVYAMGGRPLTALNLMGIPDEQMPPEVVREILRGGAAKAREAGCVILGGHTIRIPEPVYGLSVTGVVNPRRVLTNAAARPGDWLVLTKPLGTGVVTTGIKRGLARPAWARKAIESMSTLNTPGAELAERGWVEAATDITGFGLLGHLGSMCRASGVGAEVVASALPVLPGVEQLLARSCVPGGTRKNREAAEKWTEFAADVPEWRRWLVADAQTSGGLLLCVRPRRLPAVVSRLAELGALCVAIVGKIEEAKSARPRVRVSV